MSTHEDKWTEEDEQDWDLRSRLLTDSWRHEVDGETVIEPCARVEWAPTPGYMVIIIERDGVRSKVAVPGFEVE